MSPVLLSFGIMQRSNFASLFDHLVGAQQKGLWNDDAEGEGGAAINEQLELGRLFDRQIGGFAPFRIRST